VIERIDLRVRAADVNVAFDRLLPLVPRGLHPCADGDDVVLVALDAPADLPDPAMLAVAAGDVLVGPPVRRPAGADLAAALAALGGRWEIAGRVILRSPAHAPAAADQIDVVLSRDPGFGTGAHPTTRSCVELLLDLEPAGRSFADLGCGAGALTIVAAKLGFTELVGIDFLDTVTDSAVENARANGVDADFITGDLTRLERLESQVAAVNVSEFDVHVHLATIDLPELEVLIISGLDHPDRLAYALSGYERLGFAVDRRIDAGGWPAVRLRRDLA
jgi:ribosomal protein L11 methyltransferase